MKTILSKIQLKKSILFTAVLSLAFFGHSQTETEIQEFTASGTNDNPAIIEFDIPEDITVNNGENIESIVILKLIENVGFGGLPGSIPIECGELYAYYFAVDGDTLQEEACNIAIEGIDITNGSVIHLSTAAIDLMPLPIPGFPGFPFDIEVTLALEITYTTCEADAGENTVISPCKNEPIDLMDLLEGTPQANGTWTDPSNNEFTDGQITTPNLVGEYAYTYKVEEDSSCADEAILTIDVQECDYLSLDKSAMETVSVYPNPVNDVVNIKGLSEGDYQVSVLDLSGRVVKPAKSYTEDSVLNLSQVKNGIYLIKIENGSSQKTIRIVKQ